MIPYKQFKEALNQKQRKAAQRRMALLAKKTIYAKEKRKR